MTDADQQQRHDDIQNDRKSHGRSGLAGRLAKQPVEGDGDVVPVGEALGETEGEADGEALGEAEGEASGNAFRWKYTLDLPVDDKTYHVQFDDWMYLLDEGILMNK